MGNAKRRAIYRCRIHYPPNGKSPFPKGHLYLHDCKSRLAKDRPQSCKLKVSFCRPIRVGRKSKVNGQRQNSQFVFSGVFTGWIRGIARMFLVTGGAGFIGSNIIAALNQMAIPTSL